MNNTTFSNTMNNTTFSNTMNNTTFSNTMNNTTFSNTIKNTTFSKNDYKYDFFSIKIRLSNSSSGSFAFGSFAFRAFRYSRPFALGTFGSLPRLDGRGVHVFVVAQQQRVDQS